METNIEPRNLFRKSSVSQSQYNLNIEVPRLNEKNIVTIASRAHIELSIPYSLGVKYFVYIGSKTKLAALGRILPTVYINVFLATLDNQVLSGV
jgi:hypothetical protein